MDDINLTLDLDTVPYSIELLSEASKIKLTYDDEDKSALIPGASSSRLSKRSSSSQTKSRTSLTKTNLLTRYEEALRSMPSKAFAELHMAWLSDYGFSRIIDFDPEVENFAAPKPALVILTQVCLDNGVTPKGYVPEKKRRRPNTDTVKYLFDVGSDPRYYVGENKPKYGAIATRWSFSKH